MIIADDDLRIAYASVLVRVDSLARRTILTALIPECVHRVKARLRLERQGLKSARPAVDAASDSCCRSAPIVGAHWIAPQADTPQQAYPCREFRVLFASSWRLLPTKSPEPAEFPVKGALAVLSCGCGQQHVGVSRETDALGI